MTQLTNPLGSFSPGIIFQSDTGVFSSVSGSNASSFLVATGPNTFGFSQNFSQSEISFGVVQSQMVTVGGNSTTGILNPPPTGTTSSAFDPAAVVMDLVFSTVSTLSLIYIETVVTASMQESTVIINVYAGAPQFPNPISSSFLGAGYNTDYTASPIQLNFVGGPVPAFLPINIPVCAFWQFNSTANVGFPNDYLLVQELVPLGSTRTVTNTATVLNTPVQILSIGTSNFESFFVIGTIGCGDSTNFSNSNSISFMFLVQQGAASIPTITVGPSSSISRYPFLSYTVDTNTANVFLNGNGVDTFTCTMTYTITQGNLGIS